MHPLNADVFYNALGLCGMACFLVTYLLLQTGRLSSESLQYSVLNLLGAALILISLWHDWNLSAFLLECAWGAISLYGIVRYYRKRA